MALIGKREFMHHTSKYLKQVEVGEDIVITHNGKPCIKLSHIKKYSPQDLIGFGGDVKIIGDVNEPVWEEVFDDII